MKDDGPEGSAVTRQGCGAALEAAVAAWTRALGTAHVVTSASELDRYAESTIARPVRALAVLRPGDQKEVIAAVKIGARHGVPLYPISRGKNWGYSDACPVAEDNAILDLGRLDRILDVDPDLAYAVIEPGVTQGQLCDHLREKGIALWADCTGAGPETSIIGNVLDRGFGHTPYGDRARHVAGLQVVLADGRLLETGFGRFETSRVTNLYPYGVGPSLDGLFTQSGLGVVTRMGIWLMPTPQAYSLFVCSLERPEQIASFVEDLRPLRLDGTIRSVVHIGNDLRALSGSMSYPRDLSPAGGALCPALRDRLRAAHGVGAWTAAGGLYGSTRQVAAARREVKRRLAGPARGLAFVDEGKLDLAERVLRPLSFMPKAAALRRKLGTVRAVYDMNRGRPSQRFLAGAYWRHGDGLPSDLDTADPARDGCGLLWLPPILPFTGAAVRELLALAEPIFADHDFDLFVTLNTVTERALSAIMTIAFDRGSEQETARALACYDALLAATMAAGFPPYRLTPRGMETMAGAAGETLRLKAWLDPADQLSPGRYPGR